MKKLILKLFLSFFPFCIISFFILYFTLPTAEEIAHWFLFFICTYPLIVISILCYKQLAVFSLPKRILYSSFSPVIVMLYAYAVISACFTIQKQYQPHFVIFQLLMIISSMYFIFLLVKSPIKWYFKLAIFSYLLFMPYLYLIGDFSITHGTL
jgi:hypothetical protein